jgi:hypothetical protein
MEAKIREEIASRKYTIHVEVDYFTPTGRRRSQPQYSAFIRNEFLGKERVIKGTSSSEIQRKCSDQHAKWAQQELSLRVRGAETDALATAEADCERLNEEAVVFHNGLRGVLHATLSFNDRIDWASLQDHEQFAPFTFPQDEPRHRGHPPAPDPLPKSFWEFLFKSKREWREAEDARNLG